MTVKGMFQSATSSEEWNDDRLLSLRFDSPTIRVFKELTNILKRNRNRPDNEDVEEFPGASSSLSSRGQRGIRHGQSQQRVVEGQKVIPGMKIILGVEIVLGVMYIFQSIIMWSSGSGLNVGATISVVLTIALLALTAVITHTIQRQASDEAVETYTVRSGLKVKLSLLIFTLCFLVISIPIAGSVAVSFLQFDLITSYIIFYGSLALLLFACSYFKRGSQVLRVELCMDWDETPTEPVSTPQQIPSVRNPV